MNKDKTNQDRKKEEDAMNKMTTSVKMLHTMVNSIFIF